MKLTIEIDGDLESRFREWLSKQVESQVSPEQAALHFIQSALKPLSVDGSTGQFVLSNKWNVGQAQVAGAQRPCLALEDGSGLKMLQILDDRSALEIADLLVTEAKRSNSTTSH